MRAPGFGLRVDGRSGEARATTLTTPRAVVQTPVFMPVGTQATVKSQTSAEVAATGARLILANTYHLMLRPGSELVQSMGGVQRFMGWPHALLTDSGGFQVFSLAKLRKVDDDGVVFHSHLDGARHHLTPERSMQVQAELGSDIAMVLDECPPGGAERGELERAVARTTRWAQRSLEACPPHQACFGIVQGSTDIALRRAHLDEIAAMDFDGLALGGFSVGEPIEDMYAALEQLGPAMPDERPRYLMGVGKPIDLLRAIGSGIDMFDCVLPTRNARNGQALTWQGRVNLRQGRHSRDGDPLDPGCGCPVCATHSRAYLRHLIAAKEMLGPRLVTQHNLHFYAELTGRAREAILEDRYAAFAREAEARMLEGDEIGEPDD